MAVLKNPKWERFAQERAKGAPASEAYVTAGFARNDGNAARLNGNEKVAARLAEILGRAAARTEVTVADIAAQLDEDRAFARELAQAAAAISATMGKAKLLGMLKDKTELTGKDGEALAVSQVTIFALPDNGRGRTGEG